MKKHRFTTSVAVFMLLLMLALYVKALYGDYANRCHGEVEDQIYTAMDDELSLRKERDKSKKIRASYIRFDEMSPKMRDSILKIAPLPKIPPVYDVEELRSKGVIRRSGEISHQRSQDRYIEQGLFLDVEVLDSLFRSKLKIDYETNFVLSDSMGQIILQSDSKPLGDYMFSSRVYRIGLKGMQSLQLHYNIPLSPFLKITIATLALSFVIICIAILLLFIQLHTIRLKYKQLDKVNRTINGTIHDLKSPLSGAVMTMDLLKGMITRNDVKEVICRSQTSLRHQIVNIESLLSATRGDFTGFVLNKERVESVKLLEIMDCTVSELELRYHDKSPKISATSDLSSDFNINIDIVRFEGVISNLVENSLKYSDNGVEIVVSLKQEKNDFIITVNDTGWGIARKHQKKVFRQFYRVPRGEAYSRGYGIGLSQVLQIATSHDGKVTLKSQVGKGSNINIKIPIV